MFCYFSLIKFDINKMSDLNEANNYDLNEIDIHLSDFEELPKSSKYLLALFGIDNNVTENVGFFYKFIDFEKGNSKNLTIAAIAAIKNIEYLDSDSKRLEHFSSSKQGPNIYIYYLNEREKFLLKKQDLKIIKLEEFYDKFNNKHLII